MKKIIIVLLNSIILSSATIKVTKDLNTSTTKIDAYALKAYFREILNFTIADKGAQKLAKENRLLSNFFLEKYSLTDFEKARLRVMIEDYLAKLLIDRFQNKINIQDDILLSYYYDNLNEFSQPDKITIISYEFDNFETSSQFYSNIKNTKEKSEVINLYNPIIKSYKNISLFSLPSSVQSLIKKKKASYYLPPLYIGNKFKVLYIKEYLSSKKTIPFHQVKEKIKKKLFNETFLKYRNTILQYIDHKQ